MVRTVSSSRTLQNGHRSVLLPGATEAEPWEVWSLGTKPQCLQICQKPEAQKFGHAVILALPVAHVFCLPLWLNETDPKQFRGIIALQLEARGLQPRGQPPIFNWSIILEETARTLVIVAVLPGLLPVDLETDACRNFDLSVRFLPLPADSLILWREQDRLVIAITRNSKLAYFHALSESRLSSSAIQDITCFHATLQMENVVHNLKKIVSWAGVDSADLVVLQSVLEIPLVQEVRPEPIFPGEFWNLTPARVDEAKRGRAARKWQAKGAMLLLFSLVLVALAFGARLLMTSMEVNRLKKWQSDHAPSLQMVHDTQAAWNDLYPVVNRDTYPLELLLHISDAVPVDELHLTLFEAENGHLLIKAEAKNLTTAYQFLDKLKQDSHLSGYSWEMAQPHSLPNDETQLQIEGTHASH